MPPLDLRLRDSSSDWWPGGLLLSMGYATSGLCARYTNPFRNESVRIDPSPSVRISRNQSDRLCWDVVTISRTRQAQ